jgi:hypothetical protein
MRIRNFFLIAIFVVLYTACASPTQETKPVQPQQLNQTQMMRLKQDAQAINATGSAAMAAPVQAGAGVKLNPPHGQPGHICEIPVGSPLPSTPAITPGNTTVAQPANLNTTAQVSGGSKPVRLNPPHGQPGHICEIPVGSPLP